MTRANFDAAVKAAEAFLEQAKKVEWHGENKDYITTGRETGALKRRSMDLTRALTDLRRP